MRSVSRFSLITVVALSPFVIASSAFAEKASVAGLLDINDQMVAVSQQSQARVDELADGRLGLVAQYKAVLKEIDGLQIYNDQLERQIASQLDELGKLDDSLSRVTIVDRQMTPLMLRMIEGLAAYIRLDLPFLPEERSERLANLQTLMVRSDVTTAEKFRNVVEAYKVENDYGRTIEAYRGELELAGTIRQVDFLRVGRVALVYQTNDLEMTGRWNIETAEWDALGAEYRNPIRDAIRIARKQLAPDLLSLPIAAPEAVK